MAELHRPQVPSDEELNSTWLKAMDDQGFDSDPLDDVDLLAVRMCIGTDFDQVFRVFKRSVGVSTVQGADGWSILVGNGDMTLCFTTQGTFIGVWYKGEEKPYASTS